jgi:pimeloyl-ACP methyl ester carboxylesterase
VIERAITVGGLRLYVRDGPGGPASALLVHGLASTSRIWDLVAPRLAGAGVRAVAYDQRGHGRSGKPAARYGFAHTSADAAAVIRALGLRRPVVVGHSWGANVALELAVRRPRTVGALVLVDGGYRNLRDRFDWPTAKRVLAPPDLRGMSIDAFVAGAGDALGGVVDVTPEIEEVVRSLVRVDRDGRIRPRLSRANHLRILRALWAQDTVGLLRRVRVPTLVLAARTAPSDGGDATMLEDGRAAARTVRAIRGPVRFQWMEGIHDLPLQRPGALARRIVRASAP